MFLKLIIFSLFLLGSCANNTNGTLNNQHKIVNGAKVEKGQFPFAVKVYYGWENRTQSGIHVTTSSKGSQCGGSIYNERTIVTAAHCFNSYRPPAGRFGASTITHVCKILAGQLEFVNNRADKKRGGQEIWAKTVIRHNFDNKNMLNDIALIILHKPLKYSSSVGAIPIASSADNLGPITAMGWGKTYAQGALHSTILQASGRVKPMEACYYQGKRDANSQICAFGDGRGTCQGDSGGPLIGHIGRCLKLVGVTSFGDTTCKSSAVYTRVSFFADWIKDNAVGSADGRC